MGFMGAGTSAARALETNLGVFVLQLKAFQALFLHQVVQPLKFFEVFVVPAVYRLVVS